MPPATSYYKLMVGAEAQAPVLLVVMRDGRALLGVRQVYQAGRELGMGGSHAKFTVRVNSFGSHHVSPATKEERLCFIALGAASASAPHLNLASPRVLRRALRMMGGGTQVLRRALKAVKEGTAGLLPVDAKVRQALAGQASGWLLGAACNFGAARSGCLHHCRTHLMEFALQAVRRAQLEARLRRAAERSRRTPIAEQPDSEARGTLDEVGVGQGGRLPTGGMARPHAGSLPVLVFMPQVDAGGSWDDTAAGAEADAELIEVHGSLLAASPCIDTKRA